ncbi:hypothetical protein ARMSODRAFT_1025667 [Armillaria solidipes]|uniref:Uncharacterized protein n=1 Tax=Armillaria solidipes TaxID=1076256 RepID=A0A2H3BCH4_9AGAR|nr:hypothetical protein ARMSODRAFT_1025667 [Armillaria solidipes]
MTSFRVGQKCFEIKVHSVAYFPYVEYHSHRSFSSSLFTHKPDCIAFGVHLRILCAPWKSERQKQDPRYFEIAARSVTSPDYYYDPTSRSLRGPALEWEPSGRDGSYFYEEKQNPRGPKHVGQLTEDNGRNPDGKIFTTIKRALGDDDCGVLTQASYSVLSMWNHSTLSSIPDKCCCRTLILAGGVPCLDNPLIKPLRPSATVSRR